MFNSLKRNLKIFHCYKKSESPKDSLFYSHPLPPLPQLSLLPQLSPLPQLPPLLVPPTIPTTPTALTAPTTLTAPTPPTAITPPISARAARTPRSFSQSLRDSLKNPLHSQPLKK